MKKIFKVIIFIPGLLINFIMSFLEEKCPECGSPLLTEYGYSRGGPTTKICTSCDYSHEYRPKRSGEKK